MSERDQILLGVVAVVAAVGAFFFFALKPKRAETKKLDGQIVEQVERRDALQAQVAAGRAAQQKFAGSYGEVARLGKAVPPDDQSASLLYQLESAARRHRVQFNLMELKAGSGAASSPPVDGSQAAAAVAPPGTQVGAAGFPTMPFSFNFEGDFFRMERFLSQIERFTTTAGDDIEVRGRLLTIDGIGLAAATAGFPEVQAAISATAYVLPPGEGLTGGASSTGPDSAAGGQTTPTAAGVNK